MLTLFGGGIVSIKHTQGKQNKMWNFLWIKWIPLNPLT